MGHTLEPGSTLAAGRYRIDGLLGSGRTAQVHRAYDLQLARPVAVRTMLPGPVLDTGFPARLRRGAQAMAALVHPNVVTVHDTGEEPGPDGQPVPYVVMELVAGQSLADRLHTSGALPPADAVRITDQILAALAAGHARGLVHRDIKPANVLLGTDGTTKVADFGIVWTAAEAGTALTLGTPKYMSPEQVQGAADLDGRSDLYAVAVLLFEMLTGRVPFDADDGFAIAYRHVNEQPPTLAASGLAGQPQLEAVLERALAKSADERYTDAEAMRLALAVPAPAPLPAPPTVVPPPAFLPPMPGGPPPVPNTTGRRRTSLIAGISAGALVALCGVGYGAYTLLDGDAGFPEATHKVVLPESLQNGTYTRVSTHYQREKPVEGDGGDEVAAGAKWTFAVYRPRGSVSSAGGFSVTGMHGRIKNPHKQRKSALARPPGQKGVWEVVVPPGDYQPEGVDVTVTCQSMKVGGKDGQEDTTSIVILCVAADENTVISFSPPSRGTKPSAADLAEAANLTSQVRKEIRKPIG